LLALLACAWLASTGIVTWQLLHRARPPFVEHPSAALAERVESVRLATRDGEELGAWWSRGAEGSPVVLLLHGNGGSRSEMSALIEWLVSQRVSVLAVTLRAHGDSSGELNDVGWSARSDVLAAVEFIERHAPAAQRQAPAAERHRLAPRIVIFGRSLGAAAAIYAAGELGARVSAYVLEAPYRDLGSAVHVRLRNALPPPLDAIAFAGMSLWARAWLAVDVDALSPLDRITDVPRDVPIVFFTGTRDDRAHAADVEEIARRAAGHAEVVRFEGAGHGNLHAFDRERFESALARVLAGVGIPAAGR
jgi:alpha-beta hydrolase superfamily lysophospholipase